jgi:hypothetical protein
MQFGFLKSSRAVALLVVVLLVSVFAFAQDPAPSPTPIPQGAINFGGNWTSFSSVANVNGTSSVQASIFTVWAPLTGNSGKLGNISGRVDTIQMPGQSTQIYFAGLEKDWLGGKLLRLKSLTFDPNKFTVFAYGEIGGKRQDSTSLPAFSARVGGGLRRNLTPTLGVTLFEGSYVRTDIGLPTSTGTVLTSLDHAAISAGVTLSFGQK